MTARTADIRAGLRNAIDKFEKRLYSVSVSFVNPNKDSSNVHGIVIKISGNYKDGSEEIKLVHNYKIS